MVNKIESLETFIDMVIGAAEDQADLERLMAMLEDKVNKVDNMITDLEDEDEEC